MKDFIAVDKLERRFPDDEYGRPGFQLVHDEQEKERWYDHIGLHRMEREFGTLVLVSLPGDFSDATLVGIFGCGFPVLRTEELTTIWWRCELTQAFKDANEYWLDADMLVDEGTLSPNLY